MMFVFLFDFMKHIWHVDQVKVAEHYIDQLNIVRVSIFIN